MRREVVGTGERLLLSGDHLTVLGFYLLVLILSLRKLRGFLLYGFLEENSVCLLSLVLCLCFIDVHVILSVKRSEDHIASLNDKNITWYQS